MTEATPVTPADIEASMRKLQGQIGVVAEDSKKKAAIVGVILTVLIMLAIYILGRRAGVRKSTVVQIRRL